MPSSSESAGVAGQQAARRPKRGRRRGLALTLGGVAGIALLLGVINFYSRSFVRVPVTGVAWQDTPRGVVALEVEARSPAAGAGLQPGDRLLEIQGQPVDSALVASEAPWRIGPDGTLEMLLDREGSVFTASLQPEQREGEEQLYAYLATVGLFFLVSAVFLLARLGAVRITNHYFALSMAVFAVLVFSHTGSGGAADWLFYFLDSCGRLLFPAILLHFVLVFPDSGAQRPPWMRRLLYAPAAIFGLLTVWMVPLGGALRAADPVASIETLDAAELFYAAFFLTASLITLALRSSRTTKLSERRQLRWVSWGLGIGITPFVIFYLIPEALRVETPPAAGLSVLPLIILPLAFCTAILKYRLADLGLLAKHGVTVLSLTFFSLAAFALVNLTLRQILGMPGISNRVFTVLAGILVFLFYPTLRNAVGSVVDRAFYQGRYDYRRTLREFGRELNSERELRPLLAKFHERIRSTLPLRTSVMLFAGSDGLRVMEDPEDGRPGAADCFLPEEHPLWERLESEDSVLLDREERRSLPLTARELQLHALFPMRVKGRIVAVLGVGFKDPEWELNSEDRQLLVTLAAHAAAAMEGARLYEENLNRIREVELLKDYNESIVESSRVGILVLDEDGRIVGWNRAMEEMFGHDRGRVLSRKLEEALPRGLVTMLEQAPPGGPFRYTFSAPGSGQRTFNVTVSDLQGKEAARCGQVITLDDLSEQLRREQQLVQSERLASVGLLASGVAHEVNTPLTGISSYAEMLLQDGAVEASTRDVLERIRKQSWRASNIVNSLLNLSRGSGDQTEQINYERVDLNQVIEETLALFGPQLKGRRIDLRFDPAPEPAALRGNRGRLQQILLNLLLNARDAILEDGSIGISVASAASGVELQVSDSGHGIRPQDLGRIYDPFFTTKGPGTGTGLGLSVTYGIVRDHGGTIHVDSHPGEGTRFTVRFPHWEAAKATA